MKTDVTVREVMDREYVGVSESDGLIETVDLLLEEETEFAVVLRGSEVVGVLTERDVLTLLVEGPDPHDATVGDAMTDQFPRIAPDASLDAAADRMTSRDARRLVVTTGGEPLGVITEHDLFTTRAREPAEQTPQSVSQSTGSGVGTAMATDAEHETENTYENQGICEVCGTFTRELAAFNGQVLCSDCRDM